MKHIVIVGGVAGGASAAARLRRMDEKVSITLLERGPYISFANCGLPYHIGGEIIERDKLLVQTVEQFSKRFNVNVCVGHEVLSIDPEHHLVEVANGDEQYSLTYDKLLLSPGAQAILPNISGIDDPRVLVLRSLPDMDLIIARLRQIRPNVPIGVLGGGFIGLEVAEALRRLNLPVILIEAQSQVMSSLDPEMAVPVHQHLLEHGVELHLNRSLSRIHSLHDGLQLEYNNSQSVKVGMLICAVGVKAESQLAEEAGLELGINGTIKVNEYLQTSHSDIYAVGDAVQTYDWVLNHPVHLPLAGPANRQGRLAADNMLGHKRRFRGVQKTAICRVFDLSVGAVGVNEKTLKETDVDYQKVYIHSNHHAGYFPGASTIHLKLLYLKENGQILGAQATGKEGVDKRIDVLALALQARMNVYDLEELELCYAPPYGSAKDPLNQAGFVAANCLRGDDDMIYSEYVKDFVGQIVDIRDPEELKAGIISDSINIPLDSLRERASELDPTQAVLIYCQVGLRGHVASCMLRQLGFRVVNLAGGYCTYQDWVETLQEES
ncbi:FAD-dependent oxidoreductase [Celerinatantimonas diazotrophica]|uniref:NADPH-dependent 2,4-dienoyl-CoA reductase/sulfur reductase-like enzyme n=1 Tax=Celerinatantimonas diazotrophica TaxID=412034 RepID=A0A4R1KGW2_9GAMM|nr:FAD-dependent oxidoreductase [Celerinatantimonas diazotrophica]TCK63954.1 NADPH-dependent 2,4-dienoyl-CoA reductase/sulfur reductase-like enzyme [Celerinatantimonas diazotrophica]CAG9297039.1 Coenzyme A disulfide reductase [Celerinatantimonas diazotrophica]